MPTFASTISRPMSNSGLVGYWNFEEGKGNSVAGDRSGFGNIGTLTNMDAVSAWTGSATSSGQALDFDASNDYVDAGSGTQLDNLGPMTISAWYFARGEGENARGGIINKGDGDGVLVDGPEFEFGSLGFDGVDRTNAFAFGVGFSGTPLHRIASNNTVTLNKWQFVTVTWDGSNSSANVHIYIDGVEVTYQKSQDAVGTKLDDSNTNMLVGIGNFGAQSNTWNGKLDEVRIYRRVLSYEEIQRLYKLQKPRVAGGINNSGLAGYWSLDDGAGTRAEDTSFNSNNGTLTNSPTWVNGKNGKALNFVGASSQYVSIPSSLGLNTTNFTVVGWAYRANTGDHGAFIKIGGIVGGVGIGVSPNNSSGFEVSGDTLTVLYESARWIPTGQNFGTGWHQFALVVDSSGFPTVYYDGRSVYNDSTGGPTSPGSALTQIGGYTSGIPTNRFFTGAIDDVRVYNRALTSTEIYDLFTGSKASVVNKSKPERLSNGLVGYWTFDGNKIAGVTSYDSSSSGNNGTMTNGPIPTLGKVGQALNFDGSDDYVAFNSGYTLGNFSTVSAWINLNNTSGIQTITQGTTATRFFIWNSTQLQYSENTVTFSSGNVSITPGQWYHVAAVRDTTTVEIVSFYVNGVLISSSTAAIQNQNFFNYINSPTAGRVLNGKIDEVRIYNRSLSADEIKALYNIGK